MFTVKTALPIRALALAGLLLPAAAWAEDRCEGSISGGTVDFGEVDVLPGRSQDIRIPVSVQITCTKDNPGLPRRFHVCLGIDSGRWPGPRPVPPGSGDRYLCTAQGQCGNANPRMRYNLYTDPAYASILGSITPRQGTSNMLRTTIDIPAGRSSHTQTLTFYARMSASSLSINLPPGRYQNPFSGGSTALIWNQNPNQADCGHYSPAGDVRVPFTVQARVVKRCHVEADPLDFGSVPAGRENIAGQTRLRVICTPGTDYTVGLRSDHPSPKGDGWGIMQPLAGGGQGVPYSLHHNNHNGPLWGHAANLRGGNRQGSGAVQSYPVYGKVPSADYRPGKYQDTVRIEIGY
ncbi:MAG: spore coat U domain-containing protein [Eikenella sp.]|nr:spore coat U domain-containing protein [Eikenella sp.]